MDQKNPPGLGSDYGDFSPSEWEEYDQYFRIIMDEIGLQIDDVDADGNCFFKAVAAAGFGNGRNYDEVRQFVCDEMVEHKDRYENFIDENFENYIQRQRRDGTYAGNHEIQAMCDKFLISIVVYSYSKDPTTFSPRFYQAVQDQISLSFQRGNHYNIVSSSLREIFEKSDDVMDIPNSSGLTQKIETVKFEETRASNKSVDVDNFICAECEKHFSREQLLRQHMKTHASKVPCDLCGKEFIPSNLKKHIKRVHPFLVEFIEEDEIQDPDCECPYCKRIFLSATSRRSHEGRCLKKPKLSKPAPCPHCKKSLSSKSSLKRHILEQHGETKFNCELCQVVFKRQEALDNHMKTHQETRQILNKETGKTEKWRGDKQLLTLGRKSSKDIGVSGRYHGKTWFSDVAYDRKLEGDRQRNKTKMSQLRASLQQQPQPSKEIQPIVPIKKSRKQAEIVLINGEERKVIGISRRLVKPATILKSMAMAKSRMTSAKRKETAERTKNYTNKQKETGPYSCPYCTQKISTMPKLNTHIGLYHAVDPKLSHAEKKKVSPFHIILSPRSPSKQEDLLEDSPSVLEVVDHLNLYINRLWKSTMFKRYVYLVVLVKNTEGTTITAEDLVDEMEKRWNDPKFELEWYCGKSSDPGPSDYHTDMSTTDPIKSSIGSKLLTGNYKAFVVKQIVLSTKEDEGIDEAELERNQCKMETFIQLIGFVQKLYEQKGMHMDLINKQLESFPLWNILTDEEKRNAIRLGMTDDWNVFCFDSKCKNCVDDHKVHNRLFSGNLHIEPKEVKEIKLVKVIKNKDGSFGCPHCFKSYPSVHQMYCHVVKSHSPSERNWTKDTVTSLFQVNTLRQKPYKVAENDKDLNFVDEILDELNSICYQLQASHTEKYCYLVALTKGTKKLSKYDFLRKMKHCWRDPSSSLEYYIGKSDHPGPSAYHTDKKFGSNSRSTIANHLRNGGQAFFVHQFVINDAQIQQNETSYDALTRDQEKLECFIQIYGFTRRNVEEKEHMQFKMANSNFEACSCKRYFSDGEKAQAIRLGGLENVPILCFCNYPENQHEDLGYMFSGNIHVDVDNIYELKLHN